MRSPHPSLLLGVLALVLAACGTAAAGPASVAPADAATVGSYDISRAELTEIVEHQLALEQEFIDDAGIELTSDQRTELITQLQTAQLNRLINRDLLRAAADELSITQAQIDEAAASLRANIAEQLGGEEELERRLRADNLTIELVDQVLLPQDATLSLIRPALVGDTVPTREVRHILVETEQQARDVIDELADGADFAELAQVRSIDGGSGARGGDLGPALRGSYVAPFDDAAWAADIGEIVGPVESQFGFHVLEVTDEELTPADELPAQQLQQITDQELEALLGPISDSVRVDPAFGRWEPAARQLVPSERVGSGSSPAGLQP